MSNAISIIPFEAGLVAHFIRLNKAWIERYFTIEPADEQVLNDPKTNIIDAGGLIYFAVYNRTISGTFALQKWNETTLELSKMAVDENLRGNKIGHVLMEVAIEKAKEWGAKKLILYSNTTLQPALHLYRKYGFEEVPLEHSHFERANIKMQKELS